MYFLCGFQPVKPEVSGFDSVQGNPENGRFALGFSLGRFGSSLDESLLEDSFLNVVLL